MNPHNQHDYQYAGVHHGPVYVQVPERSSSTAVLLEFLPGFFIHTFGIGHIYNGRVALGLLAMFGYWFALAVNILLCFILIGIVTLPLTWILMLIFSTLSAANSANRRLS